MKINDTESKNFTPLGIVGGNNGFDVNRRMAAKATAKETVDDLKADPQNEKCWQAFEWQLEKILKEDHAFAVNMADLLKEAGSGIKASGNATVVIGNNNRVVGTGGIMIEGKDNVIITGNHNKNSRKG